MALVNATQAAQITAAFPDISTAAAAAATVGSLTTQTVNVLTHVTTATVVKHRKVILPGGRTISISEP